MAVVKAINSKSSISKIINYVADKKKTTEELMFGKDCSAEPNQAIEDMNMTKALYNKESGRQYKHFVQSFSPKDNISPEKANRIGREWAEKAFKGYEVFIATHTDKEHIHNHFIVNSVNFETGKKYEQSNADLQKYKDISNKICEREGLSLSEPKKDVLTSFNSKKYKALEKGVEGTYKSYMLDLWKNVNSSMSIATSKEQFISLMNEKGYQVNWSNSRKNITYITPENKRVRDKNLAKTFKNEKLSKEGLVNEFRKNEERLRNKGISDRRTTRDNQQVTRDTRDIGKAIMFSQYGRNEVHGSRNDKLVKTDKTKQRETGTINRAVEGRKEVSRTENNRIHTEVGQGNPRIATGNGELERNQLQEPKYSDRNNTGRQADYQQLSDQVSRNIKQNERSKDMERQSNPIHNTNRDNNRLDINDSRSISSDILLDEIVSRFDETLKKAEQKEKEKEKEKEKLAEEIRKEQNLSFEPGTQRKNKKSNDEEKKENNIKHEDELQKVNNDINTITNYRTDISDKLKKLEEKKQKLINERDNKLKIDGLKKSILEEQNKKNSLGFFDRKEKKNCNDKIDKYSKELEELESQLLTGDTMEKITKEINGLQEKINGLDKQFHKHDDEFNKLIERKMNIELERKNKHRELEKSRHRNRVDDSPNR